MMTHTKFEVDLIMYEGDKAVGAPLIQIPRSSERCFVRMKPPPRARTKRDWSSRSAALEARRETGCKWGRAELKKLLGALKALSQTTGGLEEVDYVVLKKRIPTRTVSEISVMVDSLKKKAIASARFQLHVKNWEEKQIRQAIEEWTHMASALAGTLETPISAAFIQVCYDKSS
ncbi:hypothetical protein CHARACLAT_026656 [Characodon lateralis]|uniref:Uncharacterized protein n=1 Tax=Characodon lateralis TaxID=208331 RepID=A0ABU7F6C5_9TELE|nr:hypothetical protein [Characodon lateralis]